jgi:hypothetical protein
MMTKKDFFSELSYIIKALQRNIEQNEKDWDEKHEYSACII